MNLDDYVVVELPDGKHGHVVGREYADANNLTILEDEPVLARGRLRGVFRLDGRKSKPKRNLPPAIPTTTTDDSATVAPAKE